MVLSNDGSNRPRRALGVALCLTTLSLAACGSGSSDGSAGVDVSPTTPAAKGEIDSFVWDLPVGEPISLDPLKAYNYSENTVLGNACEALLSIAPDFSLEPRLAESYERVSPTMWEYKLREGVKFWDGQPMTAKDVVYSIERHLDPANGSFYLEPFAAEITKVEEVDPRTVQVVTSRPSVIVNEMMATGLGTIGEADYIEQQGKAYGTPQGGLMCTGPFEFGEWRPGRSLTLERNDNYWDQDNAALSKQVEFEFIDDQTTLTNALLSGEIDGTYEAPASAIPQLRDGTSGDLFLGPAVNNVALLPTLTGIRGPLADVRTREALFQAIDLEGIAKTVYADAAEPLRSTLILPIDYPFAPQQFEDAYNSLPEPSGDIDKAKKLIDAADANVDRPVTLAIQAGDPRSTQTATAIVDASEQIGLPMEIEQVQAQDFANFFFDPAARDEYDLMLADNFGDFADPLEFLAFAALPGSIQNFTEYDNPKVTDLYYAAQDTGQDEEKRAELTIQAVQEFAKDWQIIPLLYTPERVFMGENITGAPASFPYQYQSWAAKVGAK